MASGKKRLNLLKATKHDEYCPLDYKLIKEIGIQTVREGLAWSRIDKGQGYYNFSLFDPILQAGKEEGIQQIWDLNHFDYPISVDPFSPEFITRFAEYARRAVAYIRKYQTDTLYIVPINEISFFAWIGADTGHWAPYKKGSKNGFAFKKQLVLASIAAMDAMRKEDNNIRFILVDPFMRRYAKPPASKKAQAHVNEFNNKIRYEAWDMLCGKKYPELGGDPKYLDIIGVNYYQHNQEWVLSSKKYPTRIRHRLMSWESPDRVSFADMLREIHQRYNKPMVVSETGSVGRKRLRWWKRVLAEVADAIKEGLPVYGVCSYPTVDRPHDAGFLLPNSGLWDFEDEDASCRRIPHTKTLQFLKNFQSPSSLSK
jgi:beta-glucosidase/6-phospho-beta-glucosidase/beta-galactosidase